MPRLIKDLQINDVSSVDRGAGHGVRVMLLKRHQGESKMDVISKALNMRERELIEFAKTDQISKAELGLVIEDMAQARRERNQSREQAFAHFIQHDPLGCDLYKIFREAPGRDHHQQAAFEKFSKESHV
jgi:hypothetical protein